MPTFVKHTPDAPLLRQKPGFQARHLPEVGAGANEEQAEDQEPVQGVHCEEQGKESQGRLGGPLLLSGDAGSMKGRLRHGLHGGLGTPREPPHSREPKYSLGRRAGNAQHDPREWPGERFRGTEGERTGLRTSRSPLAMTAARRAEAELVTASPGGMNGQRGTGTTK